MFFKSLSFIDGFMLTLSCYIIPLYIIFLVTVIRFRSKTPFNSVFFTIALSQGVVDILRLILLYVTEKFRHWSWVVWPFVTFTDDYFPRIVQFLSFWITFVQYFGVALIAINRYSILVTPMGYDVFWTKQRTLLAIALQWVTPVFLAAPLLVLDQKYEQKTKMDAPQLAWKDIYLKRLYLGSATFVVAIMTTICGVCYGLMFSKTRKRKKKRPQQQPTVAITTRSSHIKLVSIVGFLSLARIVQRRKTERNLAITGLVIFIVMLLNFSFLFLSLFGDSECRDKYEGFRFMWLLSVEILSQCNPVLLVCLNEKVRMKMKMTVKCKKNGPGSNVIGPRERI